MLYSGLDLHKHTIAIHTVDADGTLIRKTTLPTERQAITSYVDALPGPHQAVVECTGMWYWVRDLLVPRGIDRRLGHAKYLKAISYAKVKTDAIDVGCLPRTRLTPTSTTLASSSHTSAWPRRGSAVRQQPRIPSALPQQSTAALVHRPRQGEHALRLDLRKAMRRPWVTPEHPR